MSDHAASGHIVPVKLYALVFVALVALALLTTGIAFVDLGPFNTVVALVIAFTKASLVVLFFMHMRWTATTQRVVATAALFWLGILIVLSLSDYLTRGWIPVPGSWQTSLNFIRHVLPSFLG